MNEIVSAGYSVVSENCNLTGIYMEFDEKYYVFNSQNSDRAALQFYYRLWKRYCGAGVVLEFGCGVGHLARRLSRTAKTYGFEINPYAIKNISINAPNVEMIASLNDLPDSSLDSIISLHVLEHINDIDLKIIGENFSRILKPGGRLLIVVPDLGGKAKLLKGNQWLGFKDPTHINLKNAFDWKVFFVDNFKFTILNMGSDGYYDFPYSRSGMFNIGDLFRLIRTGIQFLAGFMMLSPGDGEACIFIMENSK